MGNFRILKTVSLALVSLLGVSLGQIAPRQVTVPAAASHLFVRDLVSETLIRGLGATEIKPMPATSPACFLIAGIQGPDGTLVVSSEARLLMVEGDVRRDTLREVSIKFGAPGLKIGQQLVMLTSDLEWTHQQEGEVLRLGFDRGLFNGFFNSPPQFKDVVKVARYGDELCVAAE